VGLLLRAVEVLYGPGLRRGMGPRINLRLKQDWSRGGSMGSQPEDTEYGGYSIILDEVK